MQNRSLSHLLTGLIRVSLRKFWSPIYIIGLRLRVAIWGSNAFEHAVAQAPSWIALEILKAYGVKIGTELDFHGRLFLHGTYNMKDKLHIGNQCHIGPGVTLDLSRSIILEDRCTVALNATILTHQDFGYSPLGKTLYPTHFAGVTIESGAFVGAGAIIQAGIRVGKCSVVGAGSVITEDVAPYTVVAGVPARMVKQLSADGLE
jgi:acetyltransferase-like isoleucine patch superfamily enzyme